jgi:hypothetical protein
LEHEEEEFEKKEKTEKHHVTVKEQIKEAFPDYNYNSDSDSDSGSSDFSSDEEDLDSKGEKILRKF